MYVQWFVKGISSKNDAGDPILSKSEAFDLVDTGRGIISNWWRTRPHGLISPPDVQRVLTAHDLDRHVHDYDAYGPETPFISVASGCVERDLEAAQNNIYSAVDVALEFATARFTRPGALFIGWLPVALNPAVEIASVAEAIRDLNVYHRWSPYQLEGEITAKVNIPANQISLVEWWDPSVRTDEPDEIHQNPGYVTPMPLLNHREYF
jgi:hypothetical protein